MTSRRRGINDGGGVTPKRNIHGNYISEGFVIVVSSKGYSVKYPGDGIIPYRTLKAAQEGIARYIRKNRQVSP